MKNTEYIPIQCMYVDIEESGLDGVPTVRWGRIDENGNVVKRSKEEYRYSYDGFIQWRGGKNEDANGTIYSDRLLNWDFKKHDRLCQKVFGNKGQYWDRRNSKDIEKFLRLWTGDKKLKLVSVMEYCNWANGYPFWRFDYNSPKTVRELKKFRARDEAERAKK